MLPHATVFAIVIQRPAFVGDLYFSINHHGVKSVLINMDGILLTAVIVSMGHTGLLLKLALVKSVFPLNLSGLKLYKVCPRSSSVIYWQHLVRAFEAGCCIEHHSDQPVVYWPALRCNPGFATNNTLLMASPLISLLYQH